MSFGGLGSTGLADFGLGAPTVITGASYDVSLTLAQVSSVGLDNTLTAVGAQTLAGAASLTEANTLTGAATILLADTAAIVMASENTLDEALTLGQTAGTQFSETLTAMGALTAPATSGYVTSSVLSAVAAQTEAATSGWSVTNTLTAVASQTEAVVAGFSPTAQADMVAARTLAATAVVSLTGTLLIDVALTVGQTGGWVTVGLLTAHATTTLDSHPEAGPGTGAPFTFNGRTSLDVTSVWSVSNVIDLDRAVTFTQTAAVGLAGTMSIPVSLSLAAGAGFSTSVLLDAVASDILGASGTLTPQNTLTMREALGLPALADFQVADTVEMVGALSDGQTPTFSTHMIGDLGADQSLTALASQVLSDTAELEEALPLGTLPALASVSTALIDVTQDFSEVADLAVDNVLDLDLAVSLSGSAAQTATTLQDHVAAALLATTATQTRTGTLDIDVSLPTLSHSSDFRTSALIQGFFDETYAALASHAHDDTVDMPMSFSTAQASGWVSRGSLTAVGVVDFDSHPSAPEGFTGPQNYLRSLAFLTTPTFSPSAVVVMRPAVAVATTADIVVDAIPSLLGDIGLDAVAGYDLDHTLVLAARGQTNQSSTTWVLGYDLVLDMHLGFNTTPNQAVANQLDLQPTLSLSTTVGWALQSQNQAVGDFGLSHVTTWGVGDRLDAQAQQGLGVSATVVPTNWIEITPTLLPFGQTATLTSGGSLTAQGGLDVPTISGFSFQNTLWIPAETTYPTTPGYTSASLGTLQAVFRVPLTTTWGSDIAALLLESATAHGHGTLLMPAVLLAGVSPGHGYLSEVAVPVPPPPVPGYEQVYTMSAVGAWGSYASVGFLLSATARGAGNLSIRAVEMVGTLSGSGTITSL